VDAPYRAMSQIEPRTNGTLCMSRSTAHGAQVVLPLDYTGRAWLMFVLQKNYHHYHFTFLQISAVEWDIYDVKKCCLKTYWYLQTGNKAVMSENGHCWCWCCCYEEVKLWPNQLLAVI